MKSKKVTMLVAALAVAVVALAGIGYATVAYTATTTNGNNTIDVTYVQLSQDGDAKYAKVSFIGKEYFNTVSAWTGDYNTGSEQITYTVTGETPAVSPATNVSAYIISKSGDDGLKLKITDTDGALYKIDITANAAMGGSGIHYYFGLQKGSDAIIWSADEGQVSGSTTTWTINTVPAADVSAGGITYQVIVAAYGSTTTPPTDPSAISFEFVASSLSA
ncbi:MAG: hypothetical protein II855_01200 [Candidatus Methanomethylophilaceae archaeon]|nr:hypothetical protein [Candidatus Methanomethylophilaceae archaeon]